MREIDGKIGANVVSWPRLQAVLRTGVKRWVLGAAVGLVCGACDASMASIREGEGTQTVDDEAFEGSEDEGPRSVEGRCAPEARLKVATFNLRFDLGRIEANGWTNPDNPRRDLAIATIRALDVDILGTQEGMVNQVEDLREAFEDYGFVGVGRKDGVRAGEFAGIFYRATRFTALEEGHFWLSETPERPGTVFEGSGDIRMASWVILRDEVTGEELFVMDTHWDDESEFSRQSSAELIRNRLQTLPGARPTVFMADLNQFEDGAAVQTILRSVPGERSLIDGYRQAMPNVDPNERTYHAFTGNRQGRRVDYVLHDNGLQTVAASIRIDVYEGLYPSDHFPVTGTLAWATDENGNRCARD